MPSQIHVTQNISIVGASRDATIIEPGFDTTNSGDGKGWFLVDPGTTFNLSHVTLNGAGHLVFQAIRDYGSGTIDDVAFKNIQYNSSGPDYDGRGIIAFGGTGSVVDVTNCTFANIGRIGVQFTAPAPQVLSVVSPTLARVRAISSTTASKWTPAPTP